MADRARRVRSIKNRWSADEALSIEKQGNIVLLDQSFHLLTNTRDGIEALLPVTVSASISITGESLFVTARSSLAGLGIWRGGQWVAKTVE